MNGPGGACPWAFARLPVPDSMLLRVLLIALLAAACLRPALAQEAEAAVPVGPTVPIVVDLPGLR